MILETGKIYQGDSLAVLKTFPDESVDCVITSPPYYGLRSYLPKDHPDKKKEIGSENSMDEHLKVLMEIFIEVKRVLKPSGSFWLNYGDCYGAGNRKDNVPDSLGNGRDLPLNTRNQGYEKSMLMLPERVALKMVDEQGWILRQKICWAKQVYLQKSNRTIGSAMPTSVKDRFNTTWEYLYHFTKNKRYYFNLDAVRIPVQTLEDRPMGIDREKEYPEAKRNKFSFNYRVRDAAKKAGNPQFKASKEEIKNYKGNAKYKEYYEAKTRGENTRHSGLEINATWDKSGVLYNPNGKNLPSVWLIGTEPSKELHFARFPSALCEIPIQSSCPEGGIVCDIFCGSGTTLAVAKRLKRQWVGIEINKDYIAIAKQRLLGQINPML